MKAFSKLFLLFFLLVPYLAGAQKIKMGHINLHDVVLMLPETKKADSAFFNYRKSLVTRDSIMVAQIRIFMAQVELLPDSVKAKKQDELTDRQNRIQQFEQGARDSLESKRQQLYTPISNKVMDAVKAVAKENGYSYIFDMSGGGVIYAEEAGNITDLVKKKLGLK